MTGTLVQNRDFRIKKAAIVALVALIFLPPVLLLIEGTKAYYSSYVLGLSADWPAAFMLSELSAFFGMAYLYLGPTVLLTLLVFGGRYFWKGYLSKQFVVLFSVLPFFWKLFWTAKAGFHLGVTFPDLWWALAATQVLGNLSWLFVGWVSWHIGVWMSQKVTS
jgi:hypothetical protein